MSEVVATEHGPWVRDVTADSVRHFAWGVGDNNPLWLDPEHAHRSRWQGILAPPCFAYAAHETTVAPEFDERPRIYARVDWQWFNVIRPGTELFASAKLIDTQTDADGDKQIGAVEFRDQAAALVALATTTCRRPLQARPVAAGGADRRYTDTALADIEAAILSESRCGAQLRYWEDTASGDPLAGLTKGPLSIMDIIAWCAGALGVPTRDSGVSTGGLIDESATGPQLTAWFAQLVTDWAGDDAFMHRLNVNINELPRLGYTTFLNGEVTDRWTVGEVFVVQLTLTATDQDDRTLAIATALVALASRQCGQVPLPISSAIELLATDSGVE